MDANKETENTSDCTREDSGLDESNVNEEIHQDSETPENIEPTEGIEPPEDIPQEDLTASEGIVFKEEVCDASGVASENAVLAKVESLGRMLLLICFVSLIVGTFIIAGSGPSDETVASGSNNPFSTLDFGNEDGIAVVNVYGVISFASEEQSSFPSFGSLDSGADGTVRLLRQIRNTDKVKAVVLRVNSPGGTVAASQEIYDEVKALKESGKKVVVSMGDVAASGGYYISAPANYIFASPGTMTGSIGVIMSLMDYEPVLKKIGLDYRIFKSGKFKDMGAGYREMSEEEKAMLQRMVMGSWKQFVGAVADGRIIDTEVDGRKVVITDRKVLETEICQGQIFLGTEALELGLVDELGGLHDAISKAGVLAGLGKNPHIIRTGASDGLSKFLSMFQAMAKPSLDPFQTLLKGGSLPPLLFLYVPGGK